MVIIKNPLGKYFTPTLIVFITDLHLLQTPSALLLVLLITATRLLLASVGHRDAWHGTSPFLLFTCTLVKYTCMDRIAIFHFLSFTVTVQYQTMESV